jgi:deoxyadenosine/deoxycytidine kinase
MKIVIEGPSAVGKSTLCQKLRDTYNSKVVDEIIVEPIRGFTPYEEATFYLDKEIRRWNTSVHANEILFLDTDPLKSFWFNWSLSFHNCLSLSDLENYFLVKERSDQVGYADLYIILNASHQELINRKNADVFRERDNFEWISNANTYRDKYYQHLNKVIPGHVVFIEQSDPVITYERARRAIESAESLYTPSEGILNNIIDWIRKSV